MTHEMVNPDTHYNDTEFSRRPNEGDEGEVLEVEIPWNMLPTEVLREMLRQLKLDSSDGQNAQSITKIHHELAVRKRNFLSERKLEAQRQAWWDAAAAGVGDKDSDLLAKKWVPGRKNVSSGLRNALTGTSAGVAQVVAGMMGAVDMNFPNVDTALGDIPPAIVREATDMDLGDDDFNFGGEIPVVEQEEEDPYSTTIYTATISSPVNIRPTASTAQAAVASLPKDASVRVREVKNVTGDLRWFVLFGNEGTSFAQYDGLFIAGVDAVILSPSGEVTASPPGTTDQKFGDDLLENREPPTAEAEGVITIYGNTPEERIDSYLAARGTLSEIEHLNDNIDFEVPDEVLGRGYDSALGYVEVSPDGEVRVFREYFGADTRLLDIISTDKVGTISIEGPTNLAAPVSEVEFSTSGVENLGNAMTEFWIQLYMSHYEVDRATAEQYLDEDRTVEITVVTDGAGFDGSYTKETNSTQVNIRPSAGTTLVPIDNTVGGSGGRLKLDNGEYVSIATLLKYPDSLGFGVVLRASETGRLILAYVQDYSSSVPGFDAISVYSQFMRAINHLFYAHEGRYQSAPSPYDQNYRTGAGQPIDEVMKALGLPGIEAMSSWTIDQFRAVAPFKVR